MYYILHTTTQNSMLLLLYMENINENKNPTIYSILSTHYYIINQSMNFTLGHVLCDVNPYYGLISAPGIICDQ